MAAPASLDSQKHERKVLLNEIASVILPSANLAADKAFWQRALGVAPYFDQPFYVGFIVSNQEIGLDPDAAAEGITHPVVYWRTTDIVTSIRALTDEGALLNADIRDVGQGVLLATLFDRSGNLFGVMQKPAA